MAYSRLKSIVNMVSPKQNEWCGAPMQLDCAFVPIIGTKLRSEFIFIIQTDNYQNKELSNEAVDRKYVCFMKYI